MATWNDYNDARQNPNLIPKGAWRLCHARHDRLGVSQLRVHRP